MLLSGIIFYYLRTRISMLEQSVMDQAQLLQQVVSSLKSSQYRQQMNANSNSNANMISAQHQDIVKSSEMQMNLIQVSDDDSDDSDDSDSSESSDSDDSESDNDESENGINVCTLEGSCSKIIDLSTIASSANYLKPSSSSHSEIKVIELKSNIRSDKDYLGNSSDEDDDDDDDDEDDEDEDDDDEDHDDEDENDDDDYDNSEMNNGEKNDNKNDNEHTENKNDESNNQSHGNVNIKKMKSIVIEDPTTSVSLDEMKNMPVNSLRSLAKTKLSNIDVPTINKMSKKDILKALHE